MDYTRSWKCFRISMFCVERWDFMNYFELKKGEVLNTGVDRRLSYYSCWTLLWSSEVENRNLTSFFLPPSRPWGYWWSTKYNVRCYIVCIWFVKFQRCKSIICCEDWKISSVGDEWICGVYYLCDFITHHSVNYFILFLFY